MTGLLEIFQDELLELVMQWLSTTHLLHLLAPVSHRLRQLSSRDCLWRPLASRRWIGRDSEGWAAKGATLGWKSAYALAEEEICPQLPVFYMRYHALQVSANLIEFRCVS